MGVKHRIKIIALSFSLLSSLGVEADIINFDSLAPGDTVASLNGVTFSSNIVGLDLIVTDIFDTTSGDNYLGVDDSFGFDVFFPGDEITLDFAEAITELAVSFISTPLTPGGVFGIDVGMVTSMSGILPDSVLPDGGEVFQVMFSSMTPFMSATLFSLPVAPDALYSFNIDDIDYTVAQIPLPGTFLLMGAGLAVLSTASKRRRRKMTS